MFRTRVTTGLRISSPMSHQFVGIPKRLPYQVPNLQQTRGLRLTESAFNGAKRVQFGLQIFAGFYFGCMIVFTGSMAFLYFDANSRQNIPFQLSFKDQITAVKAINKDDVLKSPRYAVKHYRRLLIELAKKENPDFDESELAPYEVPIIDSEVLVYDKSPTFSNFYIDIVLRYAKALLAKGQLEASHDVLAKIINDDLIFQKLGDAERLAASSRLLAKIVQDPAEKMHYLKRTVDMLVDFYPSVNMNEQYVLAEDSKFSDELIKSLNDLAFLFVSTYKSEDLKRKQREELLSQSLQIYLANLRALSHIRETLETDSGSPTQFPLFDCDRENLVVSICELRASIGQIMWVKGYKKNAISWSEEIISDIYYDHKTSSRAAYVVADTLDNLIAMYDSLKDPTNRSRCEKLRESINLYEYEIVGYYDKLIKQWSNILYHQGPVGLIEKPLRERFGAPERIPELEEIEDEDVE
ncbi:uncharacterized protein J8A68_005198 [[Candida] subhashii]|uniref:Uncharacterized protein n=1 Tax=[Candida] subhashii TaxID=561895 RepID=A0A8J5UJN9_9ASCO|nr:uncharacterized protein J8A68_005198 [[Candida] subhashii]KAG7661306.1 hypothetical protein J8A68_005198 [[Candida] subhashii]